jgi:signal peptide peptidase SppA
MRFQRIIEALYRQPLDITVGGFESIDAIVRPHLMSAQTPEIKNGNFVLGETDLFGTPLPEMLEVDEETGIAVVNINGPLLQHAGLIDKSCGACSYQDIVKAMNQASDNRYIENIILYISSPGGQHNGDIEVAELIAEIAAGQKDVYAFTDTTMASAAYCLAAGCSAIYSTKTAYVGCIGSIMGFVDESKAFEMRGMKPVVFASGKFKATGTDGLALTVEQCDYLQGLVDSAAGEFKEHVMLHRKDVDADAMEGQIFYGTDAEANHLIDGVVASLEELEASLAN